VIGVSAALQEIPDSLRRALEADVAHALGAAVVLAPFALPKGVADETLKLAARSARGELLGVVLCSPEIAPRLIARGCERGREARGVLGAELGRAVVIARAEGACEGRSWAIFPPARVLGSGVAAGLERRWLAGALFAWLRAVAARTAGAADDAARAATDAALGYAGREPALDARVRDAARSARALLAGGTWRPRHVLMHGDLWRGNLLGAPGAPPFSRRFVLIDWDTSRAAGYPLFDLVRAARSFGVEHGRLAREIAAHGALLGLDSAQSRAALVAALGHIGLVRESFPLERYAAMCRENLATFDAAVAS
jgi:hypothetical protein